MSQTKQTPYTGIHAKMGAKLVDFAGHLMPMQYEGIRKEHMAVRQEAGLFDVAHMGEILFQGPGALETINYMVSNDVAAIPDNHAIYTPICHPHGGIVDDCIVYKRTATDLIIVVNASNKDKDFAWFSEHARIVKPVDVSEDVALLALQGPKAAQILALAAGADHLGTIPGFGLGWIDLCGRKTMIARTGYTGEDGFEIFLHPDQAEAAWERLFEFGRPLGLAPAGLGARDTLRLEARLWLYGNDIDDTTTPWEAGMNFTVKLEKGDFIGREALVRQKEEKPKRKLVGFVATGKGIPREHHDVYLPGGTPEAPGAKIGHVTSGTRTPFLNQSIGMAYVPTENSKPETAIVVDAGGKWVPATLVKGPFYKRS
ncbi:glycine cleavage system aminomethyltransferase GcvT [Myxococcota bacterium]|nr:glycine cleavage system aminomethyltransferase GcvT [Myxococcota bacterium]